MTKLQRSQNYLTSHKYRDNALICTFGLIIRPAQHRASILRKMATSLYFWPHFLLETLDTWGLMLSISARLRGFP